MKDTARNVLAHNELVVHICDEDIITEVNETAAILSLTKVSWNELA